MRGVMWENQCEVLKMGVYKDTKRGTWFVELLYKDIFRNKKKRGFKRQSEAKK